MSQKRVRTLTEKGMELYEEKSANFARRLKKSWDSVVCTLEQRDKISLDSSVSSLNQLEEDINAKYNDYLSIYHSYDDFLTASYTENSLHDQARLQSQSEQYKTDVKEFCDLIVHKKQQLLENLMNRSDRSVLTRRSKASKTNSELLAVKYAEAQAARAKLQYVDKEAEIRKQQAKLDESEKITLAKTARQKVDLETDLNVLSQRKEAAAAVAVADALETFSDKESDIVSGIRDKITLKQLPVADPHEQVNEFVENMAREQNKEVATENLRYSKNDTLTDNIVTDPKIEKVQVGENINARDTDTKQIEFASSLTKFLLRKDLALSRITQFVDKPESFLSWKTSFRQVNDEMGVSPAEEIDLLVKWLGPESKKHAISLRTAYRKDPAKGLIKLWERLDERYGTAETVHKSLINKLERFPRLNPKDSGKWYELADILAEIEALKEDREYSVALSYFDSSIGICPIVAKLPYNCQEKWATKVSTYKKRKCVSFPPFSEFCQFVSEQAKIRNDASLQFNSSENSPRNYTNQLVKYSHQRVERPAISTRATNIATESSTKKLGAEKMCPLHKTNHSLNECKGFKLKSMFERKQFLKENKICFHCCNSSKHNARECNVSVKCDECGSAKHATAMHFRNLEKDGGEAEEFKQTVNSRCTQICGAGYGKSCAKLFLTRIYCSNNPENVVKCYTIVDEQSNRSLGKPELFSLLGIDSKEYEYTLNSCAGTLLASGRKADNCVIESIDGTIRYDLPAIIECVDIPNNRNEICTPDYARCHPHLCDIADEIPDFDKKADVLLLLGRDVIDVHHVFDQVVGPPGAPFAQRLGLGWVVIGELCLGEIHTKDTVNVNKTHLLSNGRTSLFNPCNSGVHVTGVDQGSLKYAYDPVFVKRIDDDKPSLSMEDREFLQIMDRDFHKHPSGYWIAPLPFKFHRQRLPNNREQAVKRAQILDTSLHKNPVKKQHFVEFMSKIFDKGHAELAPPLKPTDECWYLPIFGVYHPQKPDRIRGVFDSSAKFQNVSLNSVLLRGPDLTNSLLGILIRFRKEQVAVTADVEQMFYCFLVEEKHRNFLRFFWYADNNPSNELIEYRMCVQVFGNSPSPAIANYGLCKSVEDCDHDVKEFVDKDFYVDDGLLSKPSAVLAVDLLQRTQNALGKHGLRLHKIASNSADVMKSFPNEDLAMDIKNLDFESDNLPMQRSLGIGWDLNLDTFVFKVESLRQPLTRRGILSTVNSIFDPLGFLSPVTIVGKLILRDLIAVDNNWDNPLPSDIESKWVDWRDSLLNLKDIKIPRTYFTRSCCSLSHIELHVFSDASELAVSAVAYLVGDATEGIRDVSFILGKSKVAPTRGHTIPRLELCGAVLAVELAETVIEHINFSLAGVKFYTDSKVVLGYINNQSRRFFTYVSNRVQKIRQTSHPHQWNYVASESNPADVGSRGATPLQMQSSLWLSGPTFLCKRPLDTPEFFPLLDPGKDAEVRPHVVTMATGIVENFGSDRFKRFSSWMKLVSAIACLRHIVMSYHQNLPCKGWHWCETARTVESKEAAEHFILKEVQGESYAKEITCLQEHRPLDRNSSVLALDPFLDSSGLLHVGGRLARSNLPLKEKHPVLLPGKHIVSRLIISHFHELVQHQGRHFTEGAVRSAGYWITGGKNLVSSLIFNCVKCKKLRGQFEIQKMSDLPMDRVNEAAPFSYVGVDVFGPWSVVFRRTRGGLANSKRWAVLFTCLTIRAVHIEVIEEMSSSAFINALRRFVAVRGKVKQFRSDRGTNFVGATDSIMVDVINVEDDKTKKFLYNHGSVWVFNPPHSSHMGGSWERMIGIARRIIDSMLSDVQNFSHDVLVTVMAEVSAIINSRPIVPVSYD